MGDAANSCKRSVTINDLFAEYPVPRFIEQFLHRLPFSLPNAAKNACVWGAWETLGGILSESDADVMLVRSNERYLGPRPTDSASALACSQEGYTLLIRHAERHHAGIAALAQQFAETFRGAVDAHIYATPTGHFGFSWHYDAEDVFILQLAGEKEYHLRKNTVNPWPLEETLPADMQYERELMPLIRVKLHAGDLLYIPCGYWHRAVAGDAEEIAISLAIGVMSRTAMDVYDLLRPQLLESLLWRQRLPVPGGESNAGDDAAYQQLLEMLAADISKTITSAAFRESLLGMQTT